MAGGHTLGVKQGPGPRDGSYPLRIRPGQFFFPLQGARRRRFVVKRIEGEWVRILREDGSEGSLALDRLLARDREGGVHYRFHGWKARARGYRTELWVVGVSAQGGSCRLVLPEWDRATEVKQPLCVLPGQLRLVGARGSCMANLASPSASGLNIHNCRATKVRDASREANGPHPELLAEGQRYRRRSDGAVYRLLETSQPRVAAWNGRRVVRLKRETLLETGLDGKGRHFEYIGGGLTATRRARQERSRHR